MPKRKIAPRRRTLSQSEKEVSEFWTKLSPPCLTWQQSRFVKGILSTIFYDVLCEMILELLGVRYMTPTDIAESTFLWQSVAMWSFPRLHKELQSQVPALFRFENYSTRCKEVASLFHIQVTEVQNLHYIVESARDKDAFLQGSFFQSILLKLWKDSLRVLHCEKKARQQITTFCFLTARVKEQSMARLMMKSAFWIHLLPTHNVQASEWHNLLFTQEYNLKVLLACQGIESCLQAYQSELWTLGGKFLEEMSRFGRTSVSVLFLIELRCSILEIQNYKEPPHVSDLFMKKDKGSPSYWRGISFRDIQASFENCYRTMEW